jgi:hypothetical protein
MLGEYAARISVIPISPAVARRELLQDLDRHCRSIAHRPAITRFPADPPPPSGPAPRPSVDLLDRRPVIDVPPPDAPLEHWRLDEALGDSNTARTPRWGSPGRNDADGRTRDGSVALTLKVTSSVSSPGDA